MQSERKILDEIKAAIVAFENTHQPDKVTKIRITRADEQLLMLMTEQEIGQEALSKLVVGGPRAAFATLYGIPIVWDAQQFGVG